MRGIFVAGCGNRVCGECLGGGCVIIQLLQFLYEIVVALG